MTVKKVAVAAAIFGAVALVAGIVWTMLFKDTSEHIRLEGSMPKWLAAHSENALDQFFDIRSSDLESQAPVLNLKLTFEKVDETLVDASGQGNLCFGDHSHPITFTSPKPLERKETEEGVVYSGNLGGTVVTLDGEKPLAMKLVYNQTTGDAMVTLAAGTPGQEVGILFGRPFAVQMETATP